MAPSLSINATRSQLVRLARSLVIAMCAAVLAGNAHAAPEVTNVNPSSGGTPGGLTLTITGVGFTPTGNTALVDGRSCPITSESPTEIQCTLPEGTGTDKPVQVIIDDGTPSTTHPFSYDPPSVTSITPANGSTAGGFPITIYGENFGPSFADSVRSVSFGSAGGAGSACATIPGASSHASIECTAPEGEGTGNLVQVSVDGQSSNTATFDYDPPAITSITPTQGPSSGGNLLTIIGTNFGQSASVKVDTATCPLAEPQAPDRLVCTVPPGTGDVPVEVSVAGQVSNKATYNFLPGYCGDGYIDVAIGEVCDDGDVEDYDGCSAACENETPQDKDQQGCIVAANKAGAKLAKLQGKDVAACMKAASKGDETDPQTCVSADKKQKVNGGKLFVADTMNNRCAASPPDFGPHDATSVSDAAVDNDLALTHDIFGADLNLAFTPGDKARAKCQQSVQKTYEKILGGSLKEFGKCKKTGLKEATILAPSQLGNCADLMLDAKISACPAALSDVIDADCDGQDVNAVFPGRCAGSPDSVQCICQHLRCRACSMLQSTDTFIWRDCGDAAFLCD